MKRLLLLTALLAFPTTVLGQAGFIGVYSDDGGASCGLTDTGAGICTYYVVHSLAPAVSGSRFRIVSQHAGIPLGDTKVFAATQGTSDTGVEIGYGPCQDASAGLHVLSIGYYCQGTTPPCATIEVLPHPDGLSALDCSPAPQWIPASGWTSYINDDGSCPCGLPGYPEMDVSPSALTGTLCPNTSSTQSITISNNGPSELEFQVTLLDSGGMVPAPNILYFTNFPDTGQVGEPALTNLGVPFLQMSDYSQFLTQLTNLIDYYDLVLFEPAPGANYPTSPASLFSDFIATGGALITSYYHDVLLEQAMEVLWAGGNLDTVSKWTNHRVFDLPNVVPDLAVTGFPPWSFSGARFLPVFGGRALAGYAAGPTDGQAAIVLGNQDKTIVNGMVFANYLEADTDADGKPDIVELVENEIAFLLEPWLATNSTGGVVSPASSVDVDVVLDPPRWLAPGIHEAAVSITGNDPDLPEVIVPVELTLPDILAPSPSLSSLVDSIPEGGTSDHTLTLTNNGPCDVEVQLVVKHAPPMAAAESRHLVVSRRAHVDQVVAALRERSGVLRMPQRKTVTRCLTGETVELVAERPRDVARTLYAPTQSAGPVVAVLAGGFDGLVPFYLAQSLKFPSVTFIDVTFTTPTLPELQAFDAVVVWWDYPYQDRTTLGDNLADYVDGGGGVLLAVPETAGEAGRYLGGRWETEAYFLIERSDYQTGPATLGTILDPGHPLMQGVATLDGGDFSFRPSTVNVAAGATVVAAWSDDMPLAVTGDVAGVRRADLGFFLYSGDYGWQPGTDGGTLIANALEWVAGYGVRWMSLSTTSGTIGTSAAMRTGVSGGGTMNIAIALDASDLAEGDYNAEIIIGHNDPDTPDIAVPVMLHVGGQVPVLIQRFTATPADRGVELAWDVFSDEAIRGFRIYRGVGGAAPVDLLNTELIQPNADTYVDDRVSAGTSYVYRLAVVKDDGTELLSQYARVYVMPTALELHQNFPNPFNPTTTISFLLPEDAFVELSIYTLDGARVRTLVDRVLPLGLRTVRWDGRDDHGNPVSSGVYFYRLTAGKQSLSRKMVYLK